MLTYLKKYNQNIKTRPNFGGGSSSALDVMVERLIFIGLCRTGFVVLTFIGAGRGDQVRHLHLHPQTLRYKFRIEKEGNIQ